MPVDEFVVGDPLLVLLVSLGYASIEIYGISLCISLSLSLRQTSHGSMYMKTYSSTNEPSGVILRAICSDQLRRR